MSTENTTLFFSQDLTTALMHGFNEVTFAVTFHPETHAPEFWNIIDDPAAAKKACEMHLDTRMGPQTDDYTPVTLTLQDIIQRGAVPKEITQQWLEKNIKADACLTLSF